MQLDPALAAEPRLPARGAARLLPLRRRARLPARLGRGGPGTGGSCCAAPSARRGARASSTRASVERLDDELDRGAGALLGDLQAHHAREHGRGDRVLRARARGRPDRPERLLAAPSDSLAVALDDRVRDQLEQRARGRRAGSAGSAALASATSASARSRASSSAPVAAIRSHSRSACSGPLSEARSNVGELGVALAREDQRQRDGAVEQVGAARLAGALDRAGDVEHVVEQLEGQADPARERAERVGRARRAARGRPARPAGRPPRTAPRSSARSGADSARPRRAPRRRPRAAAARLRRAPSWRPRARAAGSRRRCARARRTRARTAGRRSRSPASRPAAAATVGWPRRSWAPSITSSWTSVAECTSSTATAARTSLSSPRRPSPGPPADSAASTTSSGRRRLPPASDRGGRVGGERRAGLGGDPLEVRLGADHPLAQAAAAAAHDRLDRLHVAPRSRRSAPSAGGCAPHRRSS